MVADPGHFFRIRFWMRLSNRKELDPIHFWFYLKQLGLKRGLKRPGSESRFLSEVLIRKRSKRSGSDQRSGSLTKTDRNTEPNSMLPVWPSVNQDKSYIYSL
jgi:hypothetical protein